MDKQELKNVLDKHRKWVMSEPDGERADLRNANLRKADLRDADLSDADLRGAYLRNADLRDADLSGANLSDADLRNADLRDADLSDAELRGAYLRNANLSDADLRGAYLSDAKIDHVKEDIFKVLSVAKNEVTGLYDALMRGKVDGSVYDGECACLVGTIANVRHEKYKELGIDLKPNSERPAERWFLGIRKGDIPQNNPISDITAQWMREFMDAEQIKYPKYGIVAMVQT